MNGDLGILSADFRVNETSISPGAASKQLVGQDPSRWAIIFSLGNSTIPASVTTLSVATAQTGILLVSNAPVWSGNFREFGALISSAWNGFSGGGGIINVIEILYRPVGMLVVTEEDMQALSDRLDEGGL